MKRSTFLLIAAFFGLLIGGMSLFLPNKMADGFGITATPVIIFLSRELGAFNLCTGILNFIVRNDADSKTLKAIFIFNVTYHVIMMPVNVIGLSQGVFSIGQAILPFVFHLLLGIGSFIYLTKIKTSAN